MTTVHTVKSKGKISQNFVAFSEYMNFNSPKIVLFLTKGNRMVTNSLYFVFRMLATMCLACNFVLLHAQTIQMCKIEEEQGNTGTLGRQYVYEALAQAIISPSGM